MKRSAQINVSVDGQQAVDEYLCYLSDEQDLSADTRRNYRSDLRHFAAWCEASWIDGQEGTVAFGPTMIATPTLTQYRTYLQSVLKLRPATINRHLVSLKRYFAWTVDTGLLQRDPAEVVKLVPLVTQPPRQLTDQEENALVAAVMTYGTLRDRTLLLLALHAGLRAEELCRVQRSHLSMGKRSGHVAVYGKRNKYREVPLNSTARAALEEYLPTLQTGIAWLFVSKKHSRLPDGSKQVEPITERALGYIIAKYASLAKVKDVSPHDLRHRFGYRMAKTVPLHRLAQIMGHDSLGFEKHSR